MPRTRTLIVFTLAAVSLAAGHWAVEAVYD